MTDFKTNGRIPQVSRPVNGKSHTFKVSLMDSGGGKNSLYQYSTRKTPKFKFYVATYNIRTLSTNEHLEELEDELSHIKWNILGLCKTRLRDERCTSLRSGPLPKQ